MKTFLAALVVAVFMVAGCTESYGVAYEEAEAEARARVDANGEQLYPETSWRDQVPALLMAILSGTITFGVIGGVIWLIVDRDRKRKRKRHQAQHQGW